MSSIYDTIHPDPVAVIYQNWLNGSNKFLSADDRQAVWVRIHNLEVKLKDVSDHLVEELAAEISELRKLVE
jgi:hypothetical protein